LWKHGLPSRGRLTFFETLLSLPSGDPARSVCVIWNTFIMPSGNRTSRNSWLVGHDLRCACLQDRRYKARYLASRRIVDEPRHAQ